MTNENFTIVVNKFGFLLTFFSLTLASGFGYLYFTFNNVFLKLASLEEANASLLSQNANLQEAIKELKLSSALVTPPSQTTPSIVPLNTVTNIPTDHMTDEYKIFLIKLAILVICVSVTGFSCWYFYSWAKYNIVTILSKSVFSMGSLTKFASSFFYQNDLKTFIFKDTLGNIFTVQLSEGSKVAQILIQPVNSNIKYTIEEFISTAAINNLESIVKAAENPVTLIAQESSTSEAVSEVVSEALNGIAQTSFDQLF